MRISHFSFSFIVFYCMNFARFCQKLLGILVGNSFISQPKFRFLPEMKLKGICIVFSFVNSVLLFHGIEVGEEDMRLFDKWPIHVWMDVIYWIKFEFDRRNIV